MYENRIRTLENIYKNIENDIDTLQKNPTHDSDKLKSLIESKNKYLSELRELRKRQYEHNQFVNFDDER